MNKMYTSESMFIGPTPPLSRAAGKQKKSPFKKIPFPDGRPGARAIRHTRPEPFRKSLSRNGARLPKPNEPTAKAEEDPAGTWIPLPLRVGSGTSGLVLAQVFLQLFDVGDGLGVEVLGIGQKQ